MRTLFHDFILQSARKMEEVLAGPVSYLSIIYSHVDVLLKMLFAMFRLTRKPCFYDRKNIYRKFYNGEKMPSSIS